MHEMSELDVPILAPPARFQISEPRPAHVTSLNQDGCYRFVHGIGVYETRWRCDSGEDVSESG
jgi:hypothetical protein